MRCADNPKISNARTAGTPSPFNARDAKPSGIARLAIKPSPWRTFWTSWTRTRNSCWALLTATGFEAPGRPHDKVTHVSLNIASMILQHLFPVFGLLLLGVGLKRVGLIDTAFTQAADRLIYYLFFPLLLFWKIGSAPQVFTVEALRFYASVIAGILWLCLLSLGSIRLLRINAFQAGAYSQSCYRFNTYVGMAVIFSVLGETGVAQFGVLIGLIIPLINVLAVSTLIWFSDNPTARGHRLRVSAGAILKNPLILGCLAGIGYARWVNTFPVFVENTFQLAGSVTLPLALLSIGGSLTLNALRQYFPQALAASVLKLAVLPVSGLWLMHTFAVPQRMLSVGLIFFALPTSTAVYVLSSQLGGDRHFASAAIVLSTILSFVSLSAALWWHYGQKF